MIKTKDYRAVVTDRENQGTPVGIIKRTPSGSYLKQIDETFNITGRSAGTYALKPRTNLPIKAAGSYTIMWSANPLLPIGIYAYLFDCPQGTWELMVCMAGSYRRWAITGQSDIAQTPVLYVAEQIRLAVNNNSSPNLSALNAQSVDEIGRAQ